MPLRTPPLTRSRSLVEGDRFADFRDCVADTGDRTLGPFVGRTSLPADAVFTGYRYKGNELRVAVSTVDQEIYFVRPGGVTEAWPRAAESLACA